MTWNEMKRFAVKNGWIFEKHGGKHDIYKKEGRMDRVLIERHWTQEVRPGLMKRLFKQIED